MDSQIPAPGAGWRSPGRNETIAECCERQGLTLLAVETDEDHIHVFVSAPPRFSPALIANLLKGYTSRYFREKFPRLKKVCGKEHLWTQGYYVGTAGAVSAETIKRYILENQGKELRPCESLSSHPLEWGGTSRSSVKGEPLWSPVVAE